MNYFKLEDDLNFENRWGLGDLFDSQGAELDSRDFKYGRPIDIGPPLMLSLWNDKRLVTVKHPLRISVERKGVSLDFTYSDYNIPIVTESVANLLATVANADIQRIPVGVDARCNRYELINVISLVSCIDTTLSGIKWFEAGNDIRPDLAGTPQSITKLAIDPNLVDNHHMFRPNGWEVVIIVSEVVKQAFEQANVTGVKFRKV